MTHPVALAFVALVASVALSGCKMLHDYYTNEPDTGPAHGHGHGGDAAHGDHGDHGSHDSDASDHHAAVDGGASAAASGPPVPALPASTVVDGEVHCTNPRHLAFSGKGGNFCALPCRGAGFDQDCPDGAKCSANAPMVEKGKLGAYKSYCVSKIVDGGVDSGTVVAVDPVSVPIVDSGVVVAELVDGGLRAISESDGGNIHDVARSLRGRIKKKEPAPHH